MMLLVMLRLLDTIKVFKDRVRITAVALQLTVQFGGNSRSSTSLCISCEEQNLSNVEYAVTVTKHATMTVKQQTCSVSARAHERVTGCVYRL